MALNWFLPFVLGFSVSVRTPNVGNEYDYLLNFSAEKKETMFFSIEREQELGKLYKNEEYWTQYRYKNLLIKEKYIENTAKQINYNEFQLAGAYKGFKSGYALRHVKEIPSHRFISGWEFDKAITGLSRIVAKINISTDFNSIDASTFCKFEVSLMRFLQVFALGRYEQCQNKDFWQIKTGVSVEIPQIGG